MKRPRGGRSPATDHAHEQHEHPSLNPRQTRDQQLQDETGSLLEAYGVEPDLERIKYYRLLWELSD
ncbi:hypothetical protein ACFCYB_42480 [Streptomyces sp. NPDC056309]|uniref:hypothetical protein n=1 Tax=unclassified Streptomyces TaxID=2593676 RepID=UPI0035DEF5F9